MFQALLNWILSALAILVAAQFVPGFSVNSFQTALIVALLLGVLNALIKPVLIVLTLPINILTLGLFTFVINAFLIWLTAQLVRGFSLSGFAPALLAALLLWIINLVINFVVFPIKTL